MEEIKEKIRHLITNKVAISVNNNDIHDDTSLLEEGLGLDSISIVNLIVNIENTFEFKFDDDDLSVETFQQFDRLVQTVAGRMASQG